MIKSIDRAISGGLRGSVAAPLDELTLRRAQRGDERARAGPAVSEVHRGLQVVTP
jgi:hypothetical protein